MADHRAGLTLPAVLLAGLGADLAVTLPLGRFAKQIRERRTSNLDKAGVKFVRSTESQALNPVMSMLSATAEPWALYPVAGLVATRWVAEDRRGDAATLGLALVGSAGITKLLKTVV